MSNYLLNWRGLTCATIMGLSPHTFAANLIQNGDFETGRVSPWEFGAWEQSVATVSVDDNGRGCVVVTDPGAESWAIQFRQNNLILETGHVYSLSVDVWATAALTLKADGSDETGGYNFHFGSETDVPGNGLTGSPTKVTAQYLNERDTQTGKFAFQLGLGLVPAGTTVCFDNVVLDDPDAVLPEGPEVLPISAIRVNQHGYLPGLEKRAVYVLSDGVSNTPKSWSLIQNASTNPVEVASGQTTPHGLDPASDDNIQIIDFSSFNNLGDDFVLSITDGGTTVESMAFAIGENVYAQMKYDALAYFYHNRSSTPILASVVGDEHAREAGHPDTAVETYDCIGTSGDANGCRTADVSGGWYDAGDHGKYVVNGGISAWTLLNQYERSQYLGSNAADFSDGAMALPTAEQTNGIPDILDEAAWEIEWFLKMQVPSGYPNAGMVHHKIHTRGWTAIPTLPSEDDGVRVLQPVSTAATLNMAAVAAQCGRVYKGVDDDLADRCLSAAKTAYSAAKSNPTISAPNNEILGSGLYGDANVTDEFYWAATELFLTTGETTYRNDMLASDYHDEIFLGLVDPDFEVPLASIGWPDTQLLGVISMAVIGDSYARDGALKEQARDYLTGRADHYVAESKAQGYALPFKGELAYWGSNSSVINNMIFIALANDFSCGANPDYLNSLQNGLSYLLGSNPMDQSYVTGYGERPLQEPHHRFWAKAASNLFPAPPAGALSGGPNTGLEDPIAQVDLEGCAPLKCFLDEIESWSTNEITINWNAPFAWVTAYMDEQGNEAGRNALCSGSTPTPDPEPEPEPEPEPDNGGDAKGGSIHFFSLLMLLLSTALVRRRA